MPEHDVTPEQWVLNTLDEIRAGWGGTGGDTNPFTAIVDWFRKNTSDPSEALLHTLMYGNLAFNGYDFVPLAPYQVHKIESYKNNVRGRKFVSNLYRHVYLPLNQATVNIISPTFIKTEAPEFVAMLERKGFFSEMISGGFMDEQLAADVKDLIKLTKKNQLSLKFIQETIDRVKQTNEPAFIGTWSQSPGRHYLVDKGVEFYAVPAGPLFYLFNTVYVNDLFIGGMSKKSFQTAIDTVRAWPKEDLGRPEKLIKPTEKILEWLLSEQGRNPGAFYDEQMGLVLEIRP